MLDISEKSDASAVSWYRLWPGCDDEKLVLDSVRYGGVESASSTSLSTPLTCGANGGMGEAAVNV